MKGIALGVYLACFAGDARTTTIAMRDYGAREIWLTQSPTVNTAIVAGQAGALWIATEHVQRPWLRWTVRLSVAAIHGAAAVHNARAIGQARARERRP